MKALPAILFALGITVVLALGMLVVGGNALLNQNTVPMANSPTTTVSANDPASPGSGPTADTNPALQTDQQEIIQLQALITQYQAHEKQYQSELTDAAKRLSDANQQLDQANQQLSQSSQAVQNLQQILVQLQQAGVIRINRNGQISIPSAPTN